jgi:hypothetical protein
LCKYIKERGKCFILIPETSSLFFSNLRRLFFNANLHYRDTIVTDLHSLNSVLVLRLQAPLSILGSSKTFSGPSFDISSDLIFWFSFCVFCFHLWQKIPQESFLRIQETAGNSYLRRFLLGTRIRRKFCSKRVFCGFFVQIRKK